MATRRSAAVQSIAVAVSLTVAPVACGGGNDDEARSDRAGSAGGAPASTAAPSAHVRVTRRRAQRIDGWGASVVTDTHVEPLVSPGLDGRRLARLDRLVFRAAGINLMRVFGPGHGSTRDRVGPPRMGDPRFTFMRRVGRYGVKFVLTGADAPAEMKDGKALAGGREADYGRYLASLLRFAERRVGVPFSYAAIANEPDNPASRITLSPEQSGLAYDELGRQIRRSRLEARLAPGDNTGWDATLRYLPPELGHRGVSASAGVLASHPYSGSDAQRRAVVRAARRAGVRPWQTEWTTGCAACPDDRTMKSGLEYARQIAADLSAGVTAWFAFRAVSDTSHGPIAGLVVRKRDGGPPFYVTKRFEVFRQYSSAAPPWSRRLLVRGSLGGVPVLAFRRKGALAVVLANAEESQRTVALDLGPARGTLTARRTSPAEDFRELRRRSYMGAPVQVVLPPRSVETLTLHRGARGS